MILATRFERPPSRIQNLAEVGLAVLLLAQAPLWILTLNASPEQDRSPIPLAIAPAPVPGSDPFFGASSGSIGAPLAPHTLYAVRTGLRPGAILSGPDGVQKAVGIGETVSDGVTLASVEPDHVMLAHGRTRSRLAFPPAPPPSSAPPPPPPPAPSAQNRAASPGADQAATYETALRPVTDGGSTEGYIWRPGTDGGVLSAIGLRPGDVLLRINGTPFDRDERFGELADDIAAGRPVAIEYRRNGSNYSARYTPD